MAALPVQQSSLPRELPGGWRLANVVCVYEKGQEEDPGSYTPASLTVVPGKVHATSQHREGQAAWLYEKQSLLR